MILHIRLKRELRYILEIPTRDVKLGAMAALKAKHKANIFQVLSSIRINKTISYNKFDILRSVPESRRTHVLENVEGNANITRN